MSQELPVFMGISGTKFVDGKLISEIIGNNDILLNTLTQEITMYVYYVIDKQYNNVSENTINGFVYTFVQNVMNDTFRITDSDTLADKICFEFATIMGLDTTDGCKTWLYYSSPCYFLPTVIKPVCE